MLQCLSHGHDSSSPTTSNTSAATSPRPPTINLCDPPPNPLSPGISMDGGETSPTSSRTSPLNLSQQYTIALQNQSYKDMWSRIHHPDHQTHHVDLRSPPDDDPSSASLLNLADVLHPDKDAVNEALLHAKPSTLTSLVSTYFSHSEETTKLCLHLHRSVYAARAMYHPLHRLLNVLNLDSPNLLTQSQCDAAFNAFLHLDKFRNPFPSPDSSSSHNFQEMRRCFTQLRHQLDRRLHKSRSRIRLARRAAIASVVCVIGSVVAVAASAIVITTTHALAAAVACPPLCGTAAYLKKPGSSRFTRKEAAHVKQLDAAARGAYVLNNDLDTIDRLAARLYAAVEDDRFLIKIGLERGKEVHPTMEVLKQLKKNQSNLVHQLGDLEEHICLCFNAVNRARSLLLQEIHDYQTPQSLT
ncbi:UPF0496 protein At3g19330 [Linum grandiflorum]